MLATALIAAVACPGQPAIEYPGPRRVYRTRIVACAGDRPFVLRRALLRRASSSLRSGRELTGAWAAGRWIAWAEVRYANGRSTGIVGVSRGRRTVYRRVVLRAGPRYQEIAVVITTRGELAWAAGGRLRTARVGARRARTLARDVSQPLRLEDDRTVRWFTDEGLGYADLRPWPEPGCPSRRRFRAVAESERLRVTVARYDLGAYQTATAVRACLRETGADPVVASDNGAGSFSVGGLVGDWVVLNREINSRSGCEWVNVEVYAVPSGLPGRPGVVPCDARKPSLRAPLTITASGAPAWIVDGTDRSVLLTTVGRDVIELDAAGPGGLTGLTAEGTVVRWVHDGEPRSMDLG